MDGHKIRIVIKKSEPEKKPKLEGDEIAEKRTKKEKKKIKTNIKDDIGNFNLTWEVIEKADSIFKDMGSRCYRGSKQNQLLFFCIQQAVFKLNYPCDLKLILTNLGLKKKHVNAATKVFSSKYPGYESICSFHSPLDLIENYCELLGINKEISPIIKSIGKRVIEREKLLIQHTPQRVASGLIIYYCEIKGVKLNMEVVCKTLKLSSTTINNMSKIIADIDNR